MGTAAHTPSPAARIASVIALRTVPTKPRDEAIADVALELKASMGMAMAGHGNFLPSYVRRAPGARPIESTQHTMDAIMVTLEHMTVGAKLRNLLEHSECPLANELRAALIEGFAQMHAEEIAQARGVIR